MARAVVLSPQRFERMEPMPTSFRQCHDDKAMLPPVDMRDWLSQGHSYPIRNMDAPA